MDWVKLVLEIVFRLGAVIHEALKNGDDSVLDRRVNELLGEELRSSVAKRIADARAEAKFGQ